jgi:hypothetical protein
MGNSHSGRGIKGAGGGLGGAVSDIEAYLTQEKLNSEMRILENMNVVGGPTNPGKEWYSENIDGAED